MSQPLPSTSDEGPSAPKRRLSTTDAPPPLLPINLWRLREFIDTDEKAIAFCQDHSLLPRYVACPTCECRVDTYKKQERAGRLPYFRFVCNKRQCRQASTPNEVGMKKGTWFEGLKISIQKSLVLTYCFIANLSQDRTIVESSLTNVTSSETVVDFLNYCREVCMESLYDGSEEKQIGGPNYTVEVDEAKIDKRKYNRGRLVEGQWVLGGICRETKECFLVPINDRTELTLISTIKHFVRQGSIIHTDCFPSNNRLEQEGYRHLTVNHSENLIDPNTGACTNLIESTWWAVRRTLNSNGTRKKYFAMYLAEYIWRKTHRKGDMYLSFLRAISRVYPGPEN